MHKLAASGPDLQYLRDSLRFDYDRGLFIRIKANGTAKVGDIAGCVKKVGYRYISVDGKVYRAHHLVWLYHYGEWPTSELDHIDMNKDNNRIENLRLSSRVLNLGNCGLRRNNKSGYKGVHLKKGRWVASISAGVGKTTYLGTFDTPEEASICYGMAAYERYGDHARFE